MLLHCLEQRLVHAHEHNKSAKYANKHVAQQTTWLGRRGPATATGETSWAPSNMQSASCFTHLVLLPHLIKLINAANALITKNKGTGFQGEVTMVVLYHRLCAAARGGSKETKGGHDWSTPWNSNAPSLTTVRPVVDVVFPQT